MSARFQIDYKDVDRLLQKISQLGDQAEKTINEVLHTFGVKKVVRDITKEMPISKRQKRHAKLSTWSRAEEGNLEFVVKAAGGAANKRGSFGYLVFPNEGRGPSNPLEQRFMETGLYRATNPVLDELGRAIEERITKEL
ncbi:MULTISPECIES: hypothetical protein [Rossellomorea]|uniref:hypothetical protein n=1 Tax=Rossellomorea TaxID=2837508 RepID=UPI0009ED6369|nr:hypothetical protein [Rossellomorea marisflavi]